MKSEMFSLNVKDVAKGAATAVVTGAFLAVYGIFTGGDFNLFTADWGHIGQLAANGSFGAFMGYLGMKFFSDKEGKVLGKIG